MKTPKDYGKLVYWAERDIRGWQVCKGYLLAEYTICGRMKYIVTYGEITSCVVRHLTKYSLDRRGAWASIADKEEE